ncbi:MAG: VOC family protein [Byssovorax sp.]
MSRAWPNGAHIAQVRVARPTDKLADVVAFYEQGLGLPRIASFTGHAGYDGVMLGLPGHDYHLEFVHHEAGSPCPAPSRDNLLVLYIPDRTELDGVRARLEGLGHTPVEPENPYWKDKSFTYEDPDGFRVVLCNTAGLS